MSPRRRVLGIENTSKRPEVLAMFGAPAQDDYPSIEVRELKYVHGFRSLPKTVFYMWRASIEGR